MLRVQRAFGRFKAALQPHERSCDISSSDPLGTAAGGVLTEGLQTCCLRKASKRHTVTALSFSSDGAEVDIGGKRHLAHVDGQDRRACGTIGHRHGEVQIKPAGAQHRRIDTVNSVSGW